MEFNSGRIVLDKAVDLVSLALPSKDFGDATSGILLEVSSKEPDKLTLISNSLELSITTKIKLNEKGVPGVVVPNGNILSKVVSNLKNLNNPVMIKLNKENDVLNLSCGKDYSGTLAHYDSMGFIMPIGIEEITKLPTMSIPVRLIKKAIEEISFACSKDKTHVELTGIFFDQKKDGMNIVGSDSLRMSIIQYKSKISDPKSIILSVSHLSLLKKIFANLEVDDGETIKLHLGDSMAYFVLKDTIVGMQTYGNSYYDEYANLIIKPEDCKILLRISREHFVEKLDLAVSHNNSVQDAVILTLKSKQVGLLESKFSSDTSNVNAFSIPFKINKFTGEAKKISVGINPMFLYDVFGKLKEKEILIGLVDLKNGPMTVYPVSDGLSGDYIYIFSLVD